MEINKFDIVLMGQVGAEDAITSIVDCTADLDNASLILVDYSGNMERFSDLPLAVASIPAEPGLKDAETLNAVLSRLTATYVVLCRSDIQVHTLCWLEKLQSAFEQNTACVGPGSNGHETYQGRHERCGILRPRPLPSMKGYGLGEWPLEFFCIMFDREALQEIGLFDPQFPEVHYGEDWLMRAHMGGWNFAVNTDVHVSRKCWNIKDPIEETYLRRKWHPVFDKRRRLSR